MLQKSDTHITVKTPLSAQGSQIQLKTVRFITNGQLHKLSYVAEIGQIQCKTVRSIQTDGHMHKISDVAENDQF
jgi:hypothetical protein